MKKPITLALCISMLACHPKPTTEVISKDKEIIVATDTITFTPPKNIILMIGDGMGLTQITAGMYINGNKLNLEQFKYIGLHKSYASDNLVTDSAAGATAFSCGKKTYNGAIGVDQKGKPAQTILEEAELAGFATGLVVTSSITHATPACFFAHEKDRGMMEEIAAGLLKTDVDFFVGGGKQYFDRRKDEQDLMAQLSKKGYAVSTFLDKDFKNTAIDFNKNFGYFTADGEPLPLSQGRDYFVPACQAAVNFLSNQQEKGFFLMIEGSQIDWGGHANDSDYIISEMIDFDNAIGAVLEFARQDGETLVIVTADHETGGYAINPTSRMDSIVPAFTTDKHTAALIPVFAYGPGEEFFSGIYENTSIYDKMRRALGFDIK
ncbi:MAG: alkaline phosphatase [Bacteroidetes bacterium]|nr:alkaline phosphatase [Bacteroidota bacterium]